MWTGMSLRGSWEDGAHSVLRLLVAVGAGCAWLSVVGDLGASQGSASAIWVAIGLFALSQVAGWADLRHLSSTPGLECVVAVSASVAAVAVAGASSSLVNPNGQWWPAVLTVVTATYVVLRFPGRLIALAVAALLVVHVNAWAIWLSRPTNPAIRWVSFNENLVLVFVVFALSRVLLELAASGDAADAGAREAQDDTTAASRERAALEAVHRTVHDDVLHALRMIAHDRRDVTPQAARRETAAALSRIDAISPSGGHAVPLLAALRHRAPREVTVHWSGDPQLHAPEAVVEAIEGGTHEALRNVARHSGTREAEVEVSAGPDLRSLLVHVRDQGAGFVPRPGRRASGIARSVQDRMAEVGGDATVTSTQGEGTTVLLSWSPDVAPTVPTIDLLPRPALRDLRLGMLAIPGFGLLNEVVLAPSLEHPVAGVLAAVALLTTVIALVWVRHIGPLLASWGVVSGAVCAAIAAWAVPAGSTTTTLFTLAAPSAVPALVLMVRRPRHEGILASLLVAITVPAVVLARIDPSRSPVLISSLLLAPLLAGVLGLASRWAVDTLAERWHHLRRVAAQAWRARQRAEAVRAGLMAHLDRVDRRIRPLLAGVADGSIDPTDESARTAASELDRELREDIDLGYAPRVREVIGELRRAGWTLTTALRADPPTQVDAALADLARRARAEAERAGGAARTARISALPRRDLWLLSVVVAPSEASPEIDLQARVGGSTDSTAADGYATVSS